MKWWIENSLGEVTEITEDHGRQLLTVRLLFDALEKAPRPMTLLTARELKANWRAVDHWFAVYDTWVDDVRNKALAAAVLPPSPSVNKSDCC